MPWRASCQASIARSSGAASRGGAVRAETFPLCDARGWRSERRTDRPTVSDHDVELALALLPHLAEGVSAEARNEVCCTDGSDGAQRDCLATQTSLVHGVALTAPDVAGLAAAGVVPVLRGGVVLAGEAALVEALSPDGGAGCERLWDRLDGHRVCAARELGRSIAELAAELAEAPYPLGF